MPCQCRFWLACLRGESENERERESERERRRGGRRRRKGQSVSTKEPIGTTQKRSSSYY
jgi:hypothetical protein